MACLSGNNWKIKTLVCHEKYLGTEKLENCRRLPFLWVLPSQPLSSDSNGLSPSPRGDAATRNCDYKVGKGTKGQESWNLPSEKQITREEMLTRLRTKKETCVQWGHRQLNFRTRTTLLFPLETLKFKLHRETNVSLSTDMCICCEAKTGMRASERSKVLQTD